MKQKIIFRSITFLFALTGCIGKIENHGGHDSGAYYTCPMHPTVNNNSPSSCPVCNMSLIKVEKQKDELTQHDGNFIIIEKQQQQLAGVKIDTVKFQNIISSSTILGTVAIDEEQVTTISSRINGRIEKLYIKTSGEYIRKDNPVYAIYSEQLFADEREFIALLEGKKNSTVHNKLLDDMLSASKNKLLLWGLSENQINKLVENKSASPQIIFYAPTEGYVTEILVKEGAYVEIGTILLKHALLKKVWIDAQVYTNEIEKISVENSFRVFSESNRDEVYIGHPVFNNPSVEDDRKIQMLRLRVDNVNYNLIPGMMVYVMSKSDSKKVMAIPKSAVQIGKMKTVWVMVQHNKFEKRIIETGIEDKYHIEVLSGVSQGTIIVKEGTYLLNSEFILKVGLGSNHAH